MTFSSLIFICIFLPVVFLLHSLIPVQGIRNGLLIIGSLCFYAFGEPVYVLLMLGSVLLNYALALWMKQRKWVLILAVITNIGILAVFKYAGFLVTEMNGLLGTSIPVPELALPIGISFFTFQALSYVIDVYRGTVEAEKNILRVMLYISFFPQLIAGPIVKYRDIAEEIRSRKVTVDGAALGFRRFIFGLAKKVLIANTMAVAADAVFDAGCAQAGMLSAWVGAVAYLMQIYFDFSGYSDMAIGLGQMFGFHFKENFDFPYGAVTIKEFWRRWHISLSSWFRDYVYIPLGGNRKGKVRTGLNKLLVFFLCGLWHGANWTFVLWGLFHGFFSFLEEWIPGLRKLPRFLGHIYSLLIICTGFVIFRADSVGEAFGMLGRMFSFSFDTTSVSAALQQLTPYFLTMLAAGILFAAPLEGVVKKLRMNRMPQGTESAGARGRVVLQTVLYVLAFLLLIWCLLRLSGGAYDPFIYFRF